VDFISRVEEGKKRNNTLSASKIAKKGRRGQQRNSSHPNMIFRIADSIAKSLVL
jgi:hypothetical protein